MYRGGVHTAREEGVTGKKTPGGAVGEPGHTRDTRDTRAHAGTRITRTNLTFTFTFIRHLGKTHNHRSRGDTPWRAQTFEPHNHPPKPESYRYDLEARKSVRAVLKCPSNLNHGQEHRTVRKCRK